MDENLVTASIKPGTVWRSIAETLTEEIALGRYRPGDRLPTEARLSERFGVNRHTVRRAIARMTEQGLTYPQRGTGVFVKMQPADYPLGRRVRFHQNVSGSGRTPSRRVLNLETRSADPEEAAALGLPKDALVHVFEGISLADDVPMAAFQSVFPADRFPGLPQVLAATRSVTAALRAQGVADYTRASTRITASAASPTLARQLQVNGQAPVLCTVAVNVDDQARPVEFGKAWFAADRVTLVVPQL